MKTIFINHIFLILSICIFGCRNSANNDINWNSYASDSSATVFAKVITEKMSPTEAAQIYVNWLSTISTTEQGSKAKEIIQTIIYNYDKNSIIFSAEVDRLSSTLPPSTLARIATLTSTPTEIGKWVQSEMPKEVIQSIDSIYTNTDSISSKKFRRSLLR